MTTEPDAGMPGATPADNADDQHTDGSEGKQELSRETRPLQAIEAPIEAPLEEVGAQEPVAEADADGDATVIQRAVRIEPTSRPRKTTLATAIHRTATGGNTRGVSATPRETLPADVVDEVDEWAVADQPTIFLSPRSQRPSQPAYLQTGENPVWPPQRVSPAADVRPQASVHTQVASKPSGTPPGAPPAQRSDAPGRQPLGGGAVPPRFATPTGRPLPPTMPAGIPRSALPNPRMQRFQELREQRLAHAGGVRSASDTRPVAEVVRQWWSDLRPGLRHALSYQHEARASGVHPIPAHEPTNASRLGDAFGRLAASARELTGRAQAVAAPKLKRLHDQAEQAAQALVERLEGPPTRQQAPLLGPGRIAVFFQQGITVGQAQNLLAASRARPIRLIPRRHGFLALVAPGTEAQVSERLRQHPYVRDVAYLEYDEYGQPVEPR